MVDICTLDARGAEGQPCAGTGVRSCPLPHGGLRTRRRHPVGTWVAACLALRFVRSRQWRDLRRSHALIVVVAAVVPAAIAIDVAGCSLLTTAAVTLVVASLLQAIAGDVFKIRPAAGALALPFPVAARLATLAGPRHDVLSRRGAAAHEATDTSRRRLNEPSSAGAGNTQLGKRSERFAVHAVSLYSVHCRLLITHPGRRHAAVGASRPMLTCDYTEHLLLDHVLWENLRTARLRHPVRAREPCRGSCLSSPSLLPVGSIRPKESRL